MAAETATVSLPETVTITSSQALDILGLLNAYAGVCGDFTADAEADPFYHVNNEAYVALHDQLTENCENDKLISLTFDRSLDREKVYAEKIHSIMDHERAFLVAQLRRDVNKLELLTGVSLLDV
jgi:hypothetical protein